MNNVEIIADGKRGGQQKTKYERQGFPFPHRKEMKLNVVGEGRIGLATENMHLMIHCESLRQFRDITRMAHPSIIIVNYKCNSKAVLAHMLYRLRNLRIAHTL